jgi:hypothetical protein
VELQTEYPVAELKNLVFTNFALSKGSCTGGQIEGFAMPVESAKVFGNRFE